MSRRDLDGQLAQENAARHRRMVHGPDSAMPPCRDCGAPDAAVSVPPTAIGLPLATEVVYCWPCWRWREHRGVEFDPRVRSELESEVA